jgi:hypothetical protein
MIEAKRTPLIKTEDMELPSNTVRVWDQTIEDGRHKRVVTIRGAGTEIDMRRTDADAIQIVSHGDKNSPIVMDLNVLQKAVEVFRASEQTAG